MGCDFGKYRFAEEDDVGDKTAEEESAIHSEGDKGKDSKGEEFAEGTGLEGSSGLSGSDDPTGGSTGDTTSEVDSGDIVEENAIDEPDQASPVAGDACSERDQIYCSEPDSPAFLSCENTHWVEGTCGTDYEAYCEPMDDPPGGQCIYKTEQLCERVETGERFCVTDNVHVCDERGRSYRLEECSGDTDACRGGICVCRYSCSGTCTDLMNDRQNCGKCANVCAADYSCQEGDCKREPLATTPGQALEIELRGPYLFWCDNFERKIGRVPIAGGNSSIVVERTDSIDGFASDESHLFWSEFFDGFIMRSDLDGGELTTLVSGRSEPSFVALDETAVYWLDAVRDIDNASIMKVAKTGGIITQLTTTGYHMEDLLVEKGYAYVCGDAGISRVSTSGGEIEQIVTGLTARNIATDGTYLYFAGSHGVGRVPLTGGDVTMLQPEGTDYYFSGVAVDTQYVYYGRHRRVDGQGQNGSIIRQPLAGGVLQIIVADLKDTVLLDIALDATSIYYSDLENIFKVQKP